MKRRNIVLVSAAALLIVLAALPFLVPLDMFRAPLQSQASAALGREVRVSGPLRLTLYPELGISLSDVSIANAEGAREPQMVAVDDVVVGARLMPLFARRLEVTEIVLRKPVIHLEIAADGSANWQFANASNGDAGEVQQAREQSGAPAGAFAFEQVRIENGAVTYYDARSGQDESLSGVSIALTSPRTARGGRALRLDGSLTYNAERVTVSASIDDFDAVMKGAPSGAHIGLKSNVVNADFNGRFESGSAVSGELKLGARSLRRLASWSGHPMQPGNGFGLIALETGISARDGVYSLSKANIAFDGMKLNGDLSVDTKGDVPAVTGMIAVDHLDVRPYLAPGQTENTVQATKQAEPDAPLALGGLKSVNANLTLTVGGLVIPDFTLDHAVLAVALRDGVLKADLNSLAAYGGTGKGNVTLDASEDIPSFRTALDMTGIRVQPFLNELIGVDEITSTGAVRFDVSARGMTANAMLRALDGRGEIRFTDGHITGVDLAGVARALQSVLTAQVLTGAVGESAQTEFGSLGGTFTVRNGVLRTNDLRLDNPTVEMTGTGVVDFTTHQLEFHFEPKAKRGIPGLQLVEIGVPFYVKGPWDKPSYGPDARNLAKGVINKLGEDATIPADLLKNPGRTLNSILGGRR